MYRGRTADTTDQDSTALPSSLSNGDEIGSIGFPVAPPVFRSPHPRNMVRESVGIPKKTSLVGWRMIFFVSTLTLMPDEL